MTVSLDEVFRREAARCTATLIRVLGDIDLAEDAVAEAFAIAAAQWPTRGVPANPGAWITTTARNRAIDRLRRESSRHDRHVAAHTLHARDVHPSGPDAATCDPDSTDPDSTDPDSMDPDSTADLAALDRLVDVVPDDQLRLMFVCCHPALAPDTQAALTLRLLGGLDTAEIARAFVVPEPTMAQRLVRAKRKLRDNRAAYRIPGPEELPLRLDAVLTTVALIFTEGHTATAGDALGRPDLSAEAIRLGRLLLELLPDEPEVAGLLALMLLTEARRAARLDASGRFVRLADQDRRLWDGALISEGHDLVRGCLARNRPGSYQIQAAIAAVHDDAPHPGATDWDQILALYDQLAEHRPDPVVALNRAVALGEARGAVHGLAALTALDQTRLARYQPYHAARADLLARAGQPRLAVDAYDQALALTTNLTERAFLEAQRQLAARSDRNGDTPTGAGPPESP